MNQVKRLLGFIRPYSFRLVIGVLLMMVVGVCEGLTALLIKPTIDIVLSRNPDTSGIVLFKVPHSQHAIMLQQYLPHWIHNVWSVIAFAIIGVALAKGISEF